VRVRNADGCYRKKEKGSEGGREGGRERGRTGGYLNGEAGVGEAGQDGVDGLWVICCQYVVNVLLIY